MADQTDFEYRQDPNEHPEDYEPDDDEVIVLRPGIDYGPISQAAIDSIYAVVDAPYREGYDFAELEDDDPEPDANRAAVAEQFKTALLTGLDDLERQRHQPGCVRPGDVADLIERVALEVRGG